MMMSCESSEDVLRWTDVPRDATTYIVISADASSICSEPSPRVAVFHSVASVSLILANDESRSGTSDGSGLNCSRGGSAVVTRTVSDFATMGCVGIVKLPDFVSVAVEFWQFAVYAPVPEGMRGVGYVQLIRPSGPALCSGSEPGGASP